MEDLIVRYLHFIGIITLSSMLVAQNLLISTKMTSVKLKQLILIDTIGILGAVIAMFAGLSLWLFVGKPDEFYSYNYLFHIKLIIFLVAGALSSVPSRYLRRLASGTEENVIIPYYLLVIKRIEISGIVLLPFLAVLIAQGIGNS